MIDYKKVLSFCIQHELDADELFLLFSLYVKDEQMFTEIHGEMKKYFNKHINNRYVDKVISLEERGLLEFLKPLEDKNKVDFKNLKIKEKFVDLLFVKDKEIYWNLFTQRYPREGYMGGKYFTTRPDPEKDFDLFKKHMLKNKNKSEADWMIRTIESMFDWNCVKEKPDGYATVGFSKFIYDWENILKEWQEESSHTSSNNYKSL